ncbi:glycosyltransferase [Arthrobacter sp. SAFR-179]|uniref:glycosyltransferase n=1 Tax=Arthrobacter sp. SAFR-179 TaxID=3387279 RepID=UPI003F7B370E
MKIAHIVTYVSEDGAFGGPVAVALGQLAELARMGHDVELLAGWDGKAKLSAPGVKVTLFKARRFSRTSFSGLWAPGLATAARSRAREGFRLHLHMARDLVMIPAALTVLTTTRPVIQTHGMVMPDQRFVARALDMVLMKPILRRARCLLALTSAEADGIKSIAGSHVPIQMISNGVRVPMATPVNRRRNEVVFLARLHPRKRVLVFAQMAKILHKRGIDAQFSVVGPDEGDLPLLEEFIEESALGNYLRYDGVIPPGHSVQRLKGAGVYVLPSVGEVYPMTVLEALAAGTPVVTTRKSGIAPHLSSLEAALLTGETADELADAVEKILMDDSLRERLIENGYRGIKTTFSIEAVANRLLTLYSCNE